MKRITNTQVLEFLTSLESNSKEVKNIPVSSIAKKHNIHSKLLWMILKELTNRSLIQLVGDRNKVAYWSKTKTKPNIILADSLLLNYTERSRVYDQKSKPIDNPQFSYTDSELVEELRKRGYIVSAVKTLEISL